MTTAIDVAGLRKSYGDKVVLSGVDLTPIVRCLTVEGTNSVVLGRWSPTWHNACHLHCLITGGQDQSLLRISLSSLSR